MACLRLVLIAPSDSRLSPSPSAYDSTYLGSYYYYLLIEEHGTAKMDLPRLT